MQGENRNNIVESKKVSLPLYLRRFWDDQQRKYGLEGMATILFDTQNESNQYWRFHIDPSLSFTLNEQLEKIFSNPEMTNATLRNSLKNSYLPKGFFIPKNEIQHLGKELLSEHLIVAYKFFSGFNFSKVLEAIKSDLTLIKQPEFPIPIIGTWHFFVEYIGFLKHIKAIDLHAVKAIRKVKISQIVLSKFNQLLPSEQLTQILFEVLHLFFNQKYNEKHIEKFIAKSAPEVQTFWKNWKAEIQKYLNHFFIQNSLKNQKNIFESNSIRVHPRKI